jgi:hypothetical protein
MRIGHHRQWRVQPLGRPYLEVISAFQLVLVWSYLLFVAGLVSLFCQSIQEESVRFTQKDSPREDKAKPIS